MAAVQCRLDREGGTKLFTDLVMSTKNDKIFQESIQLAICLLEGGNTEIQVTEHSIQGAEEHQTQSSIPSIILPVNRVMGLEVSCAHCAFFFQNHSNFIEKRP